MSGFFNLVRKRPKNSKKSKTQHSSDVTTPANSNGNPSRYKLTGYALKVLKSQRGLKFATVRQSYYRVKLSHEKNEQNLSTLGILVSVDDSEVTTR